MTTERISALLKVLERGQDSALLRFSLGNEYLGSGQFEEAAAQLRRAVELDPNYSAAWKLLGRSLAGGGHDGEAISAYDEGIAVADQQGDRQAAKEMLVFRKRLQKG